jgi:hypothetical protein
VCGAAIPGTPPVIALNAWHLSGEAEQLWRTLVHELVHVVQFTRPGHFGEWMEGELHNLGLRPLSRRRLRLLDQRVDVREDEAYSVEERVAGRMRGRQGAPARRL